jgi:hypothetical protein
MILYGLWDHTPWATASKKNLSRRWVAKSSAREETGEVVWINSFPVNQKIFLSPFATNRLKKVLRAPTGNFEVVRRDQHTIENFQSNIFLHHGLKRDLLSGHRLPSAETEKKKIT